MIPPFLDSGYLPPGIHECTIEEFESRFVFGIKRIEIFKGLKRLFEDLKKIGCNTVYIDGSYVTTKSRPGDADVCWDMVDDPDILRFAKVNSPILFMTKYPRMEQKTRYESDVFPANILENSSGLMFLKYFQCVNIRMKKKE